MKDSRSETVKEDLWKKRRTQNKFQATKLGKTLILISKLLISKSSLTIMQLKTTRGIQLTYYQEYERFVENMVFKFLRKILTTFYIFHKKEICTKNLELVATIKNSWKFSLLHKLYKWYQTALSITNVTLLKLENLVEYIYFKYEFPVRNCSTSSFFPLCFYCFRENPCLVYLPR